MAVLKGASMAAGSTGTRRASALLFVGIKELSPPDKFAIKHAS